MRRFLKNWMILFIIFAVLLIIGLEATPAQQQYFSFVGKVVSIYRGDIGVKGDKGEVMHFAVGRRTTYIPNRLPAVGERVKVSYYFEGAIMWVIRLRSFFLLPKRNK